MSIDCCPNWDSSSRGQSYSILQLLRPYSGRALTLNKPRSFVMSVRLSDGVYFRVLVDRWFNNTDASKSVSLAHRQRHVCW